jgi:hypothetical protein
VTRTELNTYFDRNKTKAEVDGAINLAQENGSLRIGGLVSFASGFFCA